MPSRPPRWRPATLALASYGPRMGEYVRSTGQRVARAQGVLSLRESPGRAEAAPKIVSTIVRSQPAASSASRWRSRSWRVTRAWLFSMGSPVGRCGGWAGNPCGMSYPDADCPAVFRYSRGPCPATGGKVCGMGRQSLVSPPGARSEEMDDGAAGTSLAELDKARCAGAITRVAASPRDRGQRPARRLRGRGGGAAAQRTAQLAGAPPAGRVGGPRRVGAEGKRGAGDAGARGTACMRAA